MSRRIVYVGNLGRDASEHDLERLFKKYGDLRSVWVARNPSGFAFIEFEDGYDAEDAVHNLDGANCAGDRIRVEFAKGGTGRRGRGSRGGGWGGDRGGDRRRMFDPSDKCYNCGRSGHYAYDCNSRSSGGSRDYRRRSRSRSRSPRRRRSRSRGRSYSRSPKRSRERSRSKSRSKSRSRSRSRKTRSRSGSPARRSASHSPARDRSRSRSRHRSASPANDQANGDGE